jgi:hypothetical protein
MQTKVPKKVKDKMIDLAQRQNYHSLKAMNQAMLLRFISEKPYMASEFKWITHESFSDCGGMVMFNVLVPPSAADVTDQVRLAVKQIYPHVTLTSFLLTVLVWWLKQYDALPPELSTSP